MRRAKVHTPFRGLGGNETSVAGATDPFSVNPRADARVKSECQSTTRANEAARHRKTESRSPCRLPAHGRGRSKRLFPVALKSA